MADEQTPVSGNTTPPAASEVRLVWVRFTSGLKKLLVLSPSDRPLDQFDQFRGEVIAIVESDQFISNLEGGWSKILSDPQGYNYPAYKALLLELDSCARAADKIESLRSQVITEEEKKASKGETESWVMKLLARFSVASGSVKDIIEGLPSYVKNGLTLLKELVDIYRAKE